MTRLRSLLPPLAAALAVALAPAAGMGDEDEPRTVKDLAYGEVLFHYFGDDHFTALTRLLAGLTRDELPSHARDADLMLGALFLSYGQHRLAGDIFAQVLEQSVDEALHDRAWFFLAKIWHQRGYLADAESALARIRGELPEELEPERIMLTAQVLMAQERFDAALAVLDGWRRPGDEWVGYARYNIGVALVRLGRVEEGTRVLEEVGAFELKDPDEALAALRDKANVALGYAWLQASQPAAAKPALQRVSLTGPFSNKALLGVGWADAEQENYRSALAPWVALRDRDLLDSAVQESLLAVPFAFAQLGADKQAADNYLDAIDSFGSEIDRLDRTILSIENGELVAQLLAAESSDGSGWYWRLDEVPDSVESRYLLELLASNEFQESLKSYRDLLFLNRNLDHWSESLTAFDDILDTRQRAYVERLPRIEASLGRVDLDTMARRRVELESWLLEIERSEDAVALGTPQQQQLWRDLTSLEPDIARLGGEPRADEFRDKQRFLKGLLLWDLNRDYPARLWAAKRNLRDLERELKEARRRYHEVTTAAADWPEEFASLTARIAALRPRVEGLKQTAVAALSRQRDYLQALAVDELDDQRRRLQTYRVQARFSLASIYDRAAAAAQAPPAADPAAVDPAGDEPLSEEPTADAAQDGVPRDGLVAEERR